MLQLREREVGGELVALCKVVPIDVGWDIVVELQFSATTLASKQFLLSVPSRQTSTPLQINDGGMQPARNKQVTVHGGQ